MSDHAPTTKLVRKTGPTLMDKCDIKTPGVCTAAEKGPVEAFLVVEDRQQLHVCVKCLDNLVLSGQWVEQP